MCSGRMRKSAAEPLDERPAAPVAEEVAEVGAGGGADEAEEDDQHDAVVARRGPGAPRPAAAASPGKGTPALSMRMPRPGGRGVAESRRRHEVVAQPSEVATSCKPPYTGRPRWPSTASTNQPTIRCRCCGTRPRTCSRPRSPSSTPTRSTASGPPVEDGFYYDFAFSKPISESDLPAIESRMRRIAQEDRPFVQETLLARGASQSFAKRGQDYKLELIADKVEGDEVSVYHTGDFLDLCRGPHVADHAGPEGVQAAARRGRLLARRREEAPAHPHLRHVLAIAEGARRLPQVPRGGREARPQEARQGAEALHGRRARRPGPAAVAARRRDDPPRARALHRRRGAGARLPARPHAGRRAARALPAERPRAALRGVHVPADEVRGRRGAGAAAGQLPPPHRRLPVRAAQLPRPADAHRRDRQQLALRALGHLDRHEPRALLRPQRRAHLLHARAADGRGEGRDRARPLLLRGARHRRVLATGSRRATTSKRSGSGPRSSGSGRRRRSPKRSSRWARRTRSGVGEAAFYGPKIDFQVKDAHRREFTNSTVQVDFQLPQRFRPRVRRRGRVAPATGDGAPRRRGLDGAAVQLSDRALRRRLPDLAAPVAGGGRADHRRAERRRDGDCGPDAPGQDPRRARRAQPEGRSQGARREAPEGALHRGHRTEGRRDGRHLRSQPRR